MSSKVDISDAVRPNNLDGVPDLIESITAMAKDLKPDDSETRHRLFIKARDLALSLQTPRETMLEHQMADPGLIAAINVGVDIGLWKYMVRNGPDKPQKVSTLANVVKVDPVLLGRLMRHVCAMGHLIETDEDEYRLTPFSKALSLDIIGDGYLSLIGGMGRSPIEFYKFLRNTNWKNPTDSAHTAMHASYNTDLANCFEYLRSVGLGPQINNHMGGKRQGRVPWMHPSIYPVEKTLFEGMDTAADAPLVVDVGGGLGHDLNDFKKFYPNHPGKLILQDLEVVLDDVKDIDPSIQVMPHDFLTEQPVKGARAYFMQCIMHDWPDDVCVKILGQLAKAMKPGYSKILIFEVVLPRRNAYWEATSYDILMMTQFSALERTEDNWYKLIEGSGLGLKITKLWSSGLSDVENLIEVELV
ncbi:O-methyltransferase [Geosmithia morbida]|uniref:O-methyltransferase n=1 Tax=Geosmithia morbida TaxID=1094350 RepID=A0A9P5D4F6_9HYPO|nr:O-methyltransferase [Geosmithia morbida]KAF4126002.1 O-methyltransferase [Geosmithia morbida]